MKKLIASMFLLVLIGGCSKDSENGTNTQGFVLLSTSNSVVEEYRVKTYHDENLSAAIPWLKTTTNCYRFNSEEDNFLRFEIYYGQGSPTVRNFEYYANCEWGTGCSKKYVEDQNHNITWNITENSIDGFQATYSGNLVNTNGEFSEITIEGTVSLVYGRPYAQEPLEGI